MEMESTKSTKLDLSALHHLLRKSSKVKRTNTLLATWDTIAKASEAENMSTAKMSRCVKNKNIINDYYYSVI